MADIPLVEMQHMHKRFGGVHAVEDVTIDLYPGEVVGLLGHNGAGKTVLMKMLSGAHRPDAGEIHINGQLAHIVNPRAAHDQGILSTIGLRIDTHPIQGQDVIHEGQRLPVIQGFSLIRSVDLVAEPAAGGRLERLIAATSYSKELNVMSEESTRQ